MLQWGLVGRETLREFKKGANKGTEYKWSQPVGPIIDCIPVDTVPAAPITYVSETLGGHCRTGLWGLRSWKEMDLSSGSKWPVSDPHLDPGPAWTLQNLQTKEYLTQLCFLSPLFWKNGYVLQVALCKTLGY